MCLHVRRTKGDNRAKELNYHSLLPALPTENNNNRTAGETRGKGEMDTDHREIKNVKPNLFI